MLGLVTRLSLIVPLLGTSFGALPVVGTGELSRTFAVVKLGVDDAVVVVIVVRAVGEPIGAEGAAELIAIVELGFLVLLLRVVALVILGFEVIDRVVDGNAGLLVLVDGALCRIIVVDVVVGVVEVIDFVVILTELGSRLVAGSVAGATLVGGTDLVVFGTVFTLCLVVGLVSLLVVELASVVVGNSVDSVAS